MRHQTYFRIFYILSVYVRNATLSVIPIAHGVTATNIYTDRISFIVNASPQYGMNLEGMQRKMLKKKEHFEAFLVNWEIQLLLLQRSEDFE